MPIHFTDYGDESDPGPYPVPPDAPVEGAGGPYADGDRHVLVLDADNLKLYELYHAYKQADGSWNAELGRRVRPDLQRAAARRLDLGGRGRPADPARPRPLRRDRRRGRARPRAALHAWPTRSAPTVYPATHFASDSTDPDLPPMGLRVRLRADFDVSGFPPVVQTILRGLKKYGMMVADNGTDWYVSGAPDARWDDDALHALDGVTGGDFEVVDSRALLPGAFYVSLPATATAREGVRWTRAGGFFDGAGALWTATVDYAGGAGDEPLPLTAGGEGQSGAFALGHTWPDDGRRVVAGRGDERAGAHGVGDAGGHRAQRRARGSPAAGRAGPRRRAPRADLLVPRSRRGHLEGLGQLRRRDGAAGAAPPRRQDVPAVTPLRGAARPPLHRHAVRDGR